MGDHHRVLLGALTGHLTETGSGGQPGGFLREDGYER